jgi:hypothetical protein
MKMDEKIFFEHEDVKVTSARFISGGQTYAMSNVTSVKGFEKMPARFWGIVILLFGLIVAAISLVPGVIIAACAAAYLYLQKPIFHVLLSTSAGETKALVTYQRDYLNRVISAINDAIVSRG